MFALVAMAATACVADPTMEESATTSTEVAAAKKIVNTSDGALSGEIILYVDEQTAEAWWNAAEPTRSGNVALDAIAAEMGAKSIEPVFSMNIDGDAKRERGMHRWFIVEFDDEQDVAAKVPVMLILRWMTAPIPGGCRKKKIPLPFWKWIWGRYSGSIPA